MRITIEIRRNKKGDYTASCPSLPGCTCRAGSSEEVARKLMENICGYIAALSNFVPGSLDYDIKEPDKGDSDDEAP